jgi:O-antigen/teichoic acid export membrane protein
MSKLVSNYIFTMIYHFVLMITPFITTPYVARVLRPEGIGIDAYISSIVQLFLIFSILSIPLYGSRQIAKQQSKKDRSKEFFSIYFFQLFFSLLNLGVFLLFINNVSEHRFLFMIHLISFFATTLDITWYFYGREQIKKVAIRNIAVRLISISLIFILVKDSNDLSVYILINVITLLIGQLIMWVPLLREIIFEKINFSDIIRHSRPIFVLFLPLIVVQVYILINKVLLGNISGEIEVGYYNQANKIINLGLGVVTALGTVLLPRMASEFSKGNVEGIKKYAKGTLQFVFFVTIPMIFGLIAISSNFVNWFLGNGYEPVSLLIILMSPVILFVGMATVFGIQILVSTDQQSKYTISVTIGAICSLIVNFMLVSSLGSISTSLALLVAEGIGASIQLYFVRRYISIRFFFKELFKYMSLGLFMYIVIRISSIIISTTSILLTLFQISIGILAYTVGLLIIKDPLLFKAIGFIKVKFSTRKR